MDMPTDVEGGFDFAANIAAIAFLYLATIFFTAVVFYRLARSIRNRYARRNARPLESLDGEIKEPAGVPISETPERKLFEQIRNGCPDCGGRDFLEGPSGGMSTNIYCANEKCGARFNVTPVIGIAERI